MANPEHLSELTALRPSHLVIEAFLDGEPVTRADVSSALADAEAREHFLDLVALRGGVAAMGPSAWNAPEPASSWASRRWWAAAAVVVFSVAAGFFAGQRTVDASAAVVVETGVQQSGGPVAPRPTRTITLEPGVNWTESAGAR
jgi:hypothetical protein